MKQKHPHKHPWFSVIAAYLVRRSALLLFTTYFYYVIFPSLLGYIEDIDV